MAISHSVQDYLKTIYKLQNGHGANSSVNTTLLSETMGVSAASVTSMFKKLAEMDLVRHTPYKGVALTDAGEKAALEVVRHHRLLERYLMDRLGYSWDEVDAEADRLEHVISEEFEDRIDKAMGYPTIDPHGDPIPTKDGNIHRIDTSRLSETKVGKQVRIVHVSDHDPEMLRYMEGLGLVPATRVEVRERAPFNGPLLVVVNAGEEHALGLEVARHIHVAESE
ncbi:MAG: DtxR family transcriptional regulator [Gemmatimonadetes bacterium]|nr:DtxR family transcriptional regulator [Gemmatimonadota bacterium]|tara:strand:+ start:1490 stop:2161 length:672 start_codon:yes stop_codon:yes gene_type:complete